MKKYIPLLILILLTGPYVWAQVTVTGTVSESETGNALEGATVRVKGTTIGMLTDDEGGYTLDVPPYGEVLIFSFVGRVIQEVPINGRTTINVALAPDDVSLEEVVVLGYTQQSRSRAISSVAIVGEEKIENVPLPDINQIIQGQAPGVLSTGGSGQPGAAQSIRIRGTGSLNAGRGPLYVIDGIIVETGDFVATGTNDILSNINPNDIQSVNILKDATAVSLYGARGANGVVVINTKRGSEGDTKFQIRLQSGFTAPNLGDFEMMDAQQMLQYDREVLRAGGFSEAEIDEVRPTSLANVNTDWVDLAFRNGVQNMLEFSASGGSAKTKFFVSGNYFLQEGILIESDFERFSVRTNLDHQANEKIDFSLNINISYTDQNNALDGAFFASPLQGALSNAPFTRHKDPATGELLVGRIPQDDPDVLNFESFVRDNFVRTIPLNSRFNNNLRMLGSFSIGYNILKNLRIQQKIAVDLVNVEEKSYTDPTTPDGLRFNGVATEVFTPSNTITSQTLLTGNFTLGDVHAFDGVAGFEYQFNDTERFFAQGQGFADGRLRNLSSSSLPLNVGGTGSQYSFVSYFGQLNYNLNNKYYMTASIRRDASSRFGVNNRWGTFYSVGGSWRLSEEPFFQDIDFLSNLKLRASFGTSGNAEIGNFNSLELYSFGSSYDGQPGSGPTQVPNPDLTWERNESLNIGLDFGLFNDRMGGTVEVYERVSKDMLLNRPLSATSGFTASLQNLGKLKNQGIEATINAQVLSRNDFLWSVDFNISFNRNEILELADTTEIPNGIQIWRVGEPIRAWYLRQWAGVNPADGTPLWADGEGGVTGDWNAAPEQLIGNAEPNFLGGFTNNISYKNLSVSAFFYFTQGQEVYDGTRFFLDSDGTNFGENRPTFAIDRWREPGDIAERPEAKFGGNNLANNNSTRYLFDGSYVRLRNLVVSYTFPISLTQSLKLRSIRIYAQGQNIWTYTDYPGWDPELSEVGTEFYRYPTGKSYTMGLDVGF